MQCVRCQGLMVVDHLTDLKESNRSTWLPVWRCMNCGEVVDSHIAARRTSIRVTGRASPPTPGPAPRRRSVAIRLGT